MNSKRQSAPASRKRLSEWTTWVGYGHTSLAALQFVSVRADAWPFRGLPPFCRIVELAIHALALAKAARIPDGRPAVSGRAHPDGLNWRRGGFVNRNDLRDRSMSVSPTSGSFGGVKG